MTDNCIRRFLQDEGGGYTILGIFWFMLFVGIGGLAVDVTDGFRVQTIMQATADASAHAGVIDLPDKDAAVATALAYAEDNMPAAVHGTVLVAEDVEIGVWNPSGRTFTPDASPPNAVKVTLRRTTASGNSVPVNFLRIIGLQEWNIAVHAVAIYAPPADNCLTSSFISRTKVYSGSENDYIDDICIHGQLGVKVGSTNSFEDGVQVSMIDDNDLVESQENVGLHPGPGGDPPGALLERDYDPPLVDSVPSIVAGLMDGSIVPPNFITKGPVFVTDLPSNPEPNTLYVVDNADFPSDAVISNIAVVSTQKIKIGSNTTIYNAFFATLAEFTLGSKNQIGASNYCNSGQGEVHIFAQGKISAGSRNDYNGVQVVGAYEVTLGSELVSLRGIHVEAGGDLFWGSAEKYGGCGAPSLFNPSVGGVAIVE